MSRRSRVCAIARSGLSRGAPPCAHMSLSCAEWLSCRAFVSRPACAEAPRLLHQRNARGCRAVRAGARNLAAMRSRVCATCRTPSCGRASFVCVACFPDARACGRAKAPAEAVYTPGQQVTYACIRSCIQVCIHSLHAHTGHASEDAPVPDLPATGAAGSAPGGAPPVVADRRAEGTPRPPGARIARESGALVCAGDAVPSRLPCVSQETYMYIRHRWRLYIYRPACHPMPPKAACLRVTSWSLGRAPPMHLVVTTWHACDARPLCMLALQNVIQIVIQTVISVILFV